MRTVARVVCPHPPDELVEVADVLYVRRPGDDPEYELWPSRRDGGGIGSAMYRHTEQGPMWDLRCTHDEHPGVGGLTAQLSRKTLAQLAEGLTDAEPQPATVLLPALVRTLGTLSS
jgi:hypothetical protein